MQDRAAETEVGEAPPPSHRPNQRLPTRLVVVAGTYDGVLAGWDTISHRRDNEDEDDPLLKLTRKHDGEYLKMSFAMAVHEGSVRCLSVASAPPQHHPQHPSGVVGTVDDEEGGSNAKKKRRRRKKRKDNQAGAGDGRSDAPPDPGALLSGGYDGSLNIFNLQRHAEAGELKTPHDLGTATCSSFAPPSGTNSTHALVGLSSGKIVLYKKRDWSVQHVLSGHDDKGVNCLAVHPSGRMALSGGRDGKLVLWDLTRGRLAFVQKVRPLQKGRKETINSIVWSADGNRYAFCHGTKVTARDMTTGEDLLDVNLPSRANQIAFLGGAEGLFLAAACDDGSLPVLGVGQLSDDEGEEGTRRAIMAIEPVDRLVAGDDRFKCIQAVEGGSGFLVVTANSGGVVSLIDLEGAARMMLSDDDEVFGEDKDATRGNRSDGDDPLSSEEDKDDEDEEEDTAAEFLESVRVGSGARITNITVWSYDAPPAEDDKGHDEFSEDIDVREDDEEISDEDGEREKEPTTAEKKGVKRKSAGGRGEIEMDLEAVARARDLVSQAKKRQKRKEKKKKKSKGKD